QESVAQRARRRGQIRRARPGDAAGGESPGSARRRLPRQCRVQIGKRHGASRTVYLCRTRARRAFGRLGQTARASRGQKLSHGRADLTPTETPRFVLFVVLAIFCARAVLAATAEETLARINKLPPAERQAELVREAKNE